MYDIGPTAYINQNLQSSHQTTFSRSLQEKSTEVVLAYESKSGDI
jgi:hypothetical protein